MMKRIMAYALAASLLLGAIVPGGARANEAEGTTSSAQEIVEQALLEMIDEAASTAEAGSAEAEPAESNPPTIPSPTIDPMPEYTNQSVVSIRGMAVPLSQVSVFRIQPDVPEPSNLGSTTASDTGVYEIPLSLGEGKFELYATAERNGRTSRNSDPVAFEIDLTPPADDMEVEWSNVAYNEIQLTWQPPTVPDPANPGHSIPDPGIDRYRLERMDGTLVTETTELRYVDLGLPEESYVNYKLFAIDKAGNQSGGYGVQASTFHRYASMIEPDEGESIGRPLISRDGKTIVYESNRQDRYGIVLYTIATRSKTFIEIEGDSINGPGLAISGDGRYVVFEKATENNTKASVIRFDRETGNSEPIVTVTGDNARLFSLSISNDGSKLVFVSSSGDLTPGDTNGIQDVFMADMNKPSNERIKRLSEGPNGQNATALSLEPVISGDGKYAAFISSAPELFPGGSAEGSSKRMFLYDIVAGSLSYTPIKYIEGEDEFEIIVDLLSMSSDGRYIGVKGNNRTTLLVYDRQTATLKFAWKPEGSGNPYFGSLSVSDDGRYLGVDYSMHHTQVRDPFLSVFGGVIWDTETGSFQYIGRLKGGTTQVGLGGDGNRAVFKNGEEEIYTVCFEECSDSPVDPIVSAKWSVPSNDRIFDQLKPGTDIAIQATGSAGLTVEAVVSYREAAGDGSEDPVAKETRIDLAEGSPPGLYEGVFTVAQGIAKIDAIKVMPKTGSFAGKTVSGLPVKVAGKLIVDIVTEHGDVLGESEMVLTGEMQTVSIPMASNVLHYEAYVPSDTYALKMRSKASDFLLGGQDNLAIHNGTDTSVVVTPVRSGLKVVVKKAGNAGPIQDALVTFKNKTSGAIIAEASTDSEGVANLTGEHQIDEEFTVSVRAPEGIQNPPNRTVKLKLGMNTLSYELSKTVDAIKDVTMSFAKQVGKGSAERPVIDSDSTVKVQATPGLELKAKVAYTQWSDDSRQVPGEKVLDLLEIAEGQYEGRFRITEGIMMIDRIFVQVGGSWLVKGYPVGATVASRLRLNFDFPQAGEWISTVSGASMLVGYSDKYFNYHWDSQMLKTDSRTYLFDVPYVQIAPYSLTLKPGTGPILPLQLQEMAQNYGQTLDVAVYPKYKISLSGSVKDEQGAGIAALYTLYDATKATNAIVANGSSDGNGSFSLSVESLAGAEYNLKIVPKDPAYSVETVNVVADSLIKAAGIVLKKKAFGSLSGRVYGTDGLPVEGATVTGTMLQEGIGKTYSTVTNAKGAYTLQLPAGTIEARASSDGNRGFLSPAVSVAIPATGGEQADLHLMDDAKLDLKLYTKSRGSTWQGPVDIDGTTAYHLGITSSHALTKFGSPLHVRAVAGDTVKICVNAIKANLPSECKEVKIGANNEASMEIRLEDTGSMVEFAVDNPNGGQISPISVIAVNQSVGGSLSTGFNNQMNIKNVLSLYNPGNYRMTITGANNSSAVIGFTLAAGQRLDLGKIPLQSNGKFTERQYNNLIATSDLSTPNGRITLRANYANQGIPAGRADGAKLLIELPKELEAIPGTLIVNGMAEEMKLTDGIVEVPLGNVATGGRGNVQIQMKVDGRASVKNVWTSAKIQYTEGAGKREEYIGMSVVELFPVTLRAPSKVSQSKIQLSGNAPAGEEVTVYDGDKAIGRAAVSPAGTWSLQTELVESDLIKHRLRTETTLNGARVSGQRAVIVYDPNDPGLIEVSMRQFNGRVQTFYPENGTAVFPYVVVPNYPFVYSLKFRDPNRVYDVKVRMGSYEIDVQPKDGLYTGVLSFPDILGPIWVSYETKSLPEDISEPMPSEEAVRDEMPDEFRNFQQGWIAIAGEKTPDGRTVPSGSAELEIKLEENLFAEIGITRTEVQSYTPSPQDLQRAERTGRDVYGVSVSHSREEDPASLTLTAYFPQRASTRSKGTNALTSAAGAVKVVFSLKNIYKGLDGGKKAYGAWKAYNNALKGPLFERIDKNIETAKAICDPQAAAYYTEFAEAIKFEMTTHEIGKLLMKASEKLMDHLPLGKLLYWGETQWAGKTLDDILEADLKELEDRLKQYSCKLKPYKEPAADPKYIWDPSGFLYEGYEANVLEGVSATALNLDVAANEWKVWDAEWYGQINPQISNSQGRYGWDVPEGKWKVRYEKDGYETAYSGDLDVPPPHFDVNIPMVSYLPPAVDYVKAAPGGTKLEVGFSKPMSGESVGDGSIIMDSAGGVAIPGTVQLKDPVTVPGGNTLSKVLVFRPDQPVAEGRYKVTISAELASYAGVPLGQEASREVDVVAKDVTPPAKVEELSGGLTDTTASLVWEQPRDLDFSVTRIHWKKAGEAAYGHSVDVAKDKSWVTITGLDFKGGYEFMAYAVDESGNESSGVPLSLIPAAKVDLAPPYSVQNFNVKPSGAGKLAAVWSDPVAEDLAKLRLTWKPEGSDTGEQTADVAKGVNKYAIEGLKSVTKYKVAIVAIDASGNESAITSQIVETSADSVTSPGGGTNSGGGPSGSGTNNESSKEWKVGAEGGILDAFEGRFKLHAEKDTFLDGMKLTVEELPNSGVALPSGYSWHSSSYSLTSDKAEPKKPMKLSLSFDPATVDANDVRRLGIYKKDSSKGWSYVGGIIDSKQHRVSVNVKELGEYAILLYNHPFSDLSEHWARKDIDVLVSRHLLNGVTEERFEPNRAVSRAEFARMAVQLLRALRDDGTASSGATAKSFADIPAGAWYEEAVNEASALGLIYGANGRFRPNDPVSREEAAVILARALGFDPTNDINTDSILGQYKDGSIVSKWASKSSAYLIQAGVLNGSGGKLLPAAQTTRAESASLLLRALNSRGRIVEP
ncbi:S-layer homology domain-containing protein [Cohnella herbarum]|uniref:Uncharacterized protein n=1 Tax=Cohnella herbarum TaxID=2728023 RepID=A0A7Z2VNQ7_9BACL|nr:S-layer homology domain-containing protein [Cohnella herbarum]QJD86371.1 hypothetical protein HH215_26535 [Cohnella herbarum]